MSWLNHRNNIITIATITAALLLFGDKFGLSITKGIMGSQVTLAMILGAGSVYIAFALWKKYI